MNMHLDGLKDTVGSDRGFAIDTTFVLFFLGLEFGRTLQNLTFDTVLLLITMLMVAVLPYYLPSNYERPSFAKWLAGRSLIAVLCDSDRCDPEPRHTARFYRRV